MKTSTWIFFFGITPLLFTGCLSLPPEVKESVDETRQLVAELHKVHAQDARAYARLVEQRENYLQQSDAALRSTMRAMAEAQVAAAVAKTMAEFDHRAADVLGIEFQDTVSRRIMPPFCTIEHPALAALTDARALQAALTNDPGICSKIVVKERDLLHVHYERENAINSYFLALDSNLRNARFRFETEVEAQCSEKLKAFLDKIEAAPSANQQIEAFNKSIDSKIGQLDEAYYAVDHSLSDLSTFLDSEATSRRFIRHTVKGVATAVIEDLDKGQLGGKPLSEIFPKANVDFSKQLQDLQSGLEAKAEQAVRDAAGSIISPAPRSTDLRAAN